MEHVKCDCGHSESPSNVVEIKGDTLCARCWQIGVEKFIEMVDELNQHIPN